MTDLLLATSQSGSPLLGFFIFIGIVFFYFLPSITAQRRKAPDIGAVFVLNFFLGWTLIGWIVALALAYRTPSTTRDQQVAEAFVAAQPSTVSNAPQPGWYPDPTGHGDRRWWDGARWTESVIDAMNQPLPPNPIG